MAAEPQGSLRRVDKYFTRRHHPTKLRTLEVIDGRPIAFGTALLAIVVMTTQDHKETLFLFAAKLGRHYPIVLRIPWLQLNDVTIRFVLDQITFGPQHRPVCRCADRDQHCNLFQSVINGYAYCGGIHAPTDMYC